MHYTHLTKIKAHYTHPQAYIQILHKKKKKNWWPPGNRKRVNILWKFNFCLFLFLMKYKSKTLQEQGRENNKILYILCQVVWRARKKERKRSIKKYQGGLASAWNAFLLNVFNSMGYLGWWAKLFHAKEPEKFKLVLKISILVLGKTVYSHEHEDVQMESWDISDNAGLCREQRSRLIWIFGWQFGLVSK